MKIKKLTFVLLSILSTASFAGNYADKNAESSPTNNKEDGSHFYIDVGANAYYFNQPAMNLPVSVGAFADGPPYPTTPGNNYSIDRISTNPNLTLGYEFVVENETLQKIFGQQNAIELHANYFHNTGTDTVDYGNNYYVVPWFIDGAPDQFFYLGGSSLLKSSQVNFDNSYTEIGLNYTGSKVINNNLLSAAYVGVDFNALKQNSNYTADMYSASDTDFENLWKGDGSDDLSSYSYGIVFGETLTRLLSTNYAVYGKVGAGVYWMHTTLAATQVPIDNFETASPYLNETYYADDSENKLTFKTSMEIGINYYLNNNQDLMSPRITVLAGADYWNNVAYVKNPTCANEPAKIAYSSTVNPYAGVELHIPF
jgi:hypothetical protein